MASVLFLLLLMMMVKELLWEMERKSPAVVLGSWTRIEAGTDSTRALCGVWQPKACGEVMNCLRKSCRTIRRRNNNNNNNDDDDNDNNNYYYYYYYSASGLLTRFVDTEKENISEVFPSSIFCSFEPCPCSRGLHHYHHIHHYHHD